MLSFSHSIWEKFSKCDYENLLIIYGSFSKPHPKHCHVTRSQSIFSAITCCTHSCMCSKCIFIQRLTFYFLLPFLTFSSGSVVCTMICHGNLPQNRRNCEMDKRKRLHEWSQAHLKVEKNAECIQILITFFYFFNAWDAYQDSDGNKWRR